DPPAGDHGSRPLGRDRHAGPAVRGGDPPLGRYRGAIPDSLRPGPGSRGPLGALWASGREVMAMSLRGLFFIGIFGVCSLWALADPFAGVVAYVTHYQSSPERSWWGAGLASLGVRYSYTITACLTVGTILNLGRLPYGRLITRQEALYLAFL